MPIDSCPSCGNDIYAPYNYCNACDWEAKGKKKREIERELEKMQASKKRKERGRRESSERKKRTRDEEWEPIPSKKPSRRRGKRKPPKDDYEEWEPVPSEKPSRRRGKRKPPKDDYEEWEPVPSEKPSRRRGKRKPPKDDYEEWAPPPTKRRSERRGRKPAPPDEDYDEWEAPRKRRTAPKRPKPQRIPCKCGGTIVVKSNKRPIKIECPECGRTGMLKTAPPDEPEPPEDYERAPPSRDSRAQQEYERQLWGGREEEVKYCDSCGTRLSVDNFCPRCGTNRESHSRKFVSYDQPYSDPYGSTYDQPYEHPYSQYPAPQEPPRGREERGGGLFGRRHKARESEPKKPRKGKCKDCGSKNLQFLDDGTGRCPNCGRTFQWHEKPSRGRPAPEEAWGGDGREDRRAPKRPPPKADYRQTEEEYYCPECGLPMQYVAEYQQYYCEYCREYE